MRESFANGRQWYLLWIARRLLSFRSDVYMSIGGVAVAVGLLALLYVGYAPLRIAVVVACLVAAVASLVMTLVKQDAERERRQRSG